MKITRICTVIIAIIITISGCSQESADKIRYDMEKLSYQAKKISDRIAIQPDLSTSQDSLDLMAAYRLVLDNYFKYRDDPLVTADSSQAREINRLAISAQARLARLYAAQRNSDSVIAAYRRIGTDIPANKEDRAGAIMALALTYRALGQLDSCVALYDRLLAEYYPPVDSLGRVNTDLMSIPLDKIKIGQSTGESSEFYHYVMEAQQYYDKLRADYPEGPLNRAAIIHTARVYALTHEWDKTLAELRNVKDSTGQIEVQALVLMANIYNGPKKDLKRGIDIYREVLERHPDSSIIGATMLRLGSALLAEKEYEECRQILADLKRRFGRIPSLVVKAQLLYAQAFEEQGRWDRALSEYQWLMENYPYTEEAFRAALHIPEHFAEAGDNKLAEIWFDRAIESYKRAAHNKQGQATELVAYTFLADAYRRTEKWNDALETLEKISIMAPGSSIGARSLYNAARVAYNELDDSARAQEYLDRLKSEFGTTDSTQINQDVGTQPTIDLESLQ